MVERDVDFMDKIIKKHKLKFVVLVFIVILIIFSFIIITVNNKATKKQEHDITEREVGEPIDPYNYLEEGEEFITNENADLLTEVKETDSYLLSDFKLVAGPEKNRIILKIENSSDAEIAGREIKIELYDHDKNILDTLYVYVPDISSGGSLALTAFTKVDMEVIYDYQVTFLD